MNGFLYKRLDADTFVRYDAARDAYDLVPAHAVPRHMTAVSQPGRVPNAVRRADPAGEFRKLLAVAVVEAFVLATEERIPSAARRTAAALVALADVPTAARSLGLNWLAPLRDPAAAVEPAAPAPRDPNGVSVADLKALPVRLGRMSLSELRQFRAVAEVGWNARRFRTSGALEKVLRWANDPASWKQPVRG